MSENQNIEYKQSWRDEYLKWICGFANATGGKIYIGVDDNGEVVGVPDTKRLLEDIPNKIVNFLGIVADVNLLREGDLEYLEIIVAPSKVPISCRGVYHYRSGSTKQELNGTALQHFLLKRLGRTWDDLPCDWATFDDIDREAVTYFISPIRYEGLQRIEELEIPEDSLREAIFNSIIHNDYTGAPIQLSVYSDRLMLWNEGRLPDEFTMEMFLGKHPSKPANRNIAEIFFKAGFIETWGRGVSKIRKGFLDKGMEEPTFEFSMGGLWVVMRRKEMVTPQVTVSVTPQVTPQVIPQVIPQALQIMGTSEMVEKLLTVFRENPECKFVEIKEGLGFSDRMYVKNNFIRPLLEAGILRFKYPDSPNHPKQRYLLNEIK